MVSILHIHLLGDFLLTLDDTPLTTINSPRLQSLLAYLVLHRAAPQNRSHLAFLLWPDSTEAQAHTNLRQLLYHLRQSLPAIDRFLYVDKHSIWWQPGRDEARWTLDVLELEQALLQAEQAEQLCDMITIQRKLEQVMQLYRGDLLPGCYDEWLLPERDRLHQAFLHAAERLIVHLQQEGEDDAAVTIARQLLRLDPLYEPAYRQIMSLYSLHGNRAAALRTYHTCATVMERELGTKPEEETQAIYTGLVRSNNVSRERTHPSVRETTAPLIGRKAEWQHLQKAWRKAVDGHPQIVLLSGEAGIGKTRLAEEMETWVHRQGKASARACCYVAQERLAYAPVTTWFRSDVFQNALSTLDPVWLSEVARLVPEMLIRRPQLPRPTPMAEEWQRQYFFEALARATLSIHQPLLLILDDLQWCDAETLAWLHFLFRFEPIKRLLLICTVRSAEITPELPLQPFLATMQRNGLVTELALKPLPSTETVSLAAHILGHQLAVTMIDRLYAETEGNPLFIVEMARAGTLEQSINTGAAGTDGSLPLLTHPASNLPPTIQTVLTTRLAQLSPLAREVANVAAIIGREFPFSVLVRASGKEENTVIQGLDELWQRRIVCEQNTGTSEAYSFSHDKLREQLSLSLSPIYRRLLHRQIAEALEQVYAKDLDGVSGQLATHFEQARLPEHAIAYYQRSGAAALRIYANAAAIAALERAATLLEANISGQQWETAVQIHESLGDIFATTGQLQKARQAYQRARAALPLQEPIQQARLQRKIASTWNHATANPRDIFPTNAQQAFQEAEQILERVIDQSSSAWQHEWIELQFAQIWPLRGSEGDMAARIEKVRSHVEQYGTKEQRELLFYAKATLDLIHARYEISEQQLANLRQAVTMVQHTGDRGRIGILHLTFGITLLWSGHPAEAEEQLEEGLRIAEQLDLAWLQIRCLTFLLFIDRKHGQVERVRTLLTRALEKSAGRKNSILTGHSAWVAWRDGNLTEADTYGRTSLEEDQERPDLNIFRWTGLWPLLGVALTREELHAAIEYTRMLLDPIQQLPVKEVRTLLTAALQAWDVGQREEAQSLLQRAVPLAKQQGYL